MLVFVPYSETPLKLASSPASPIFFNARERKDRGGWGRGYSKAATIGTNDYGRYTGVALTQVLYKPHPLKRPFRSC